jgi:PAS domain S-box-containing protein
MKNKAANWLSACGRKALSFFSGRTAVVSAGSLQKTIIRQSNLPITIRLWLFEPMRPFKKIGIQAKMRKMTLLICGAVLCVAIVALFTFQVLNFRANFERETATLAVIIANNSTAAMAFKDEQTATEVISSLRAKPTVLAATLVFPDKSVLAHYGRAEDAKSWQQFPPPGQSQFVGGQLLTAQTVIQKNERLGTLYLRSDYQRTFWELVKFYSEVVLGVVLVAAGLGGILASRLARTITTPVLQLAETAQIVGQQKKYSVRAVVDDHGDELTSLAESFNEMLGRIESQDEALSLSQQKMEALIHSIDGVVWERSADSRRHSFVSRQSEVILGYPPDDWIAQANFWAEKLHPQDAEKVIRQVQELAARGEPYACEYRMIAADGRTVWIRESGMVLVEHGKAIAVRGILQDITRQKKDAEELDQLNRKLIDASRQAGMADVATGVLHNVGNVLNSVSVATTVVGERLRQSKLGNLRRAAAMMREQNGHLAEFLTNDPKGRLLPEYLDTVAGQLTEEQDKLIAKVETVAQHVEHIKEIVAMQQSYAKVSGAYENLPVVELIEDALRINVTSFERHGIELVREYEPDLPAVCVDRHKVLQILINLVRNAKHAVEDGGSDHRRMVIKACRTAPGRVIVCVQDNGVGISRENLTKIFTHGFTTKKDGHGFGLHSGANAAKELGGSLMAYSDGPGKGAEFVLELPTTDAARKKELAAKG